MCNGTKISYFSLSCGLLRRVGISGGTELPLGEGAGAGAGWGELLGGTRRRKLWSAWGRLEKEAVSTVCVGGPHGSSVPYTHQQAGQRGAESGISHLVQRPRPRHSVVVFPISLCSGLPPTNIHIQFLLFFFNAFFTGVS